MRDAGTLSWDDVKIFLALCRGRTVKSAAMKLRVDASTVSRRLAALEEVLSTKLFARGRDGITLTEAAETLMPVAEEIEGAMTRFATAAERLEHDDVIEGVVRITCPPDVAEVIVAPLLGELHAHHPALHVVLDPGESVVDLTRREADLALRTVRPKGGDLVVTRLATTRWVVAATPKLARSLGTLKRWTDAPWIGWGDRCASLAAARWLTKHVRVEPVMRSNSLGVQLAATRTGVGVVLVPQSSLAHYALVPIKLSTSLLASAAEWPEDDLFLVTHEVLRNVPRIRVVWEMIRAHVRDRFPSGQSRARRRSDR